MDLTINQFIDKSFFAGFGNVLSINLIIKLKSLVILLAFDNKIYYHVLYMLLLEQNITSKRQVYKDITKYYKWYGILQVCSFYD